MLVYVSKYLVYLPICFLIFILIPRCIFDYLGLNNTIILSKYP